MEEETSQVKNVAYTADPIIKKTRKPREKKIALAGVDFKKIYEELSKPIELEYIVEYKENGKTLKGFRAIAAVNRLNEVIGMENWTTRAIIEKEEQINGAWVIAMTIEVIITLGEKEIIRGGSGGAYATKIENAYKGARTSAFKNACKYLGIGKELYMESFGDDDIVYTEETAEEVSEEIIELENKIKAATSLEQLKQLEDEVKNVSDSNKANVFKKYNDKKIEFIAGTTK
jgi:hypothetical protein